MYLQILVQLALFLKLDLVEEIDIKAEPDDYVGTISGVGGSEFVYLKRIDALEFGSIKVEDVVVDIGIMEYGFDIDGIIGMDILLKIKSIIDLDELKVSGKV